MSSVGFSFSSLVGQDVAGFRIAEIVGEGGMAVVFRATNVLSPSIQRAIKVVRPELASNEEFVKRFAEEALTLERLQHPNVVRFFGLRTATSGSAPLLVMELEFLQGSALSSAAKRSGAPLAVADAARWIFQAAEGVAAAHAMGVVHRDLKPDNLFLTSDGAVKVLDFGLARALDDADRKTKLTVVGTVPGSPPYMAPEVCNGGTPTAAADVYALGMSLFELILGHHPFTPPGHEFQSATQLMFAQVSKPLPPLRAIRAEVTPELEQVLSKATAKDPAARYGNARELADALGALTFSSSPNRAPLRTQFAVPTLGAASTPMAVATPVRVDDGATKTRRWPLAIASVLAVVGLGAVGWYHGRVADAAAAPEGGTTIAATAASAPPAKTELNPFVKIEPAPAGARRPLLGLGDRADAKASGFHPNRQVQAPSAPYAIQKHEVTWQELNPFIDSQADPDASWLPSDRAQLENLPVTGVPWKTALRYCESLGGSLPTEEQWEWAARGSELRPSPWGASKLDLVRTAAFRGTPERPQAVMTALQDVTPTGIWDLAGNAQEWTLDIYRGSQAGEDDSWAQSGQTSFRAVRGLPLVGALEPGLQTEIAAYRTALCGTGNCPKGTREASKFVGFRCVKEG